MNVSLRLGILVLAIMLSMLFKTYAPSSVSELWSQEFRYADFDGIPKLNLIEDVHQEGQKLRLTSAMAWQTGGAWYSEQVYVEGGFRTTFQFQITELGGTQPEPGADGIAFVIQNATNTSYGASGEGLGYQGIPNSLAVEYDTWDDYWLNEPNNNHISIQTRGTEPNSHDPLYSLGYTTAIPDLSDGAIHTTTIEYVFGHLSVYLNDVLVLTVELDLAQTLALDKGRAWVGFTSATGAAWENHDLLNWTFNHASDPNNASQPAFDLPFIYDNFAAALLGNISGQGSGRVNAWFDHTSPTLSMDSDPDVTRWDGCVSPGYAYTGHNGTDFRPFTTNEEVFAAAPGVVYAIHDGCVAGDLWCGPGYGGNQVFIDHLNGYVTRYAHLNEVLVPISRTITISETRTTPLGTMGNTGYVISSSPGGGIHLHFAVYHDPLGGRPSTSRYDQQVDPFGYVPIHCDDGPPMEPWNGEDRYLWREPLYTSATVGERLITASSATGNIQVSVPSGAVAQPADLELWEIPLVNEPVTTLRSIGRSMWLRLFDSAAQAGLPGNAPLVDFQQPVTMSIRYDPEITKHLDVEQLAIYRWDEEQANWAALPTTVNTSENRVTATTDQPGDYDVQAPLLCGLDIQEPNDYFGAATVLPTTMTSLQQRFDVSGDEDWYMLDTTLGIRYTFNVMNLAPGIHSVIELYDSNASTLLSRAESSIDYGATIIWRPTHGGVYYIRVIQPSTAVFGCDLAYELTVQPEWMLFLPGIFSWRH